MNSFIQFLLVISFICYDGIDPSPQKKLTKKQKGIIESLVSFADSLNGKTKSSSIILTKIATLKNDNVEFMPFYHLDIDKFYEDPTPENLLLSLYQPDTLAMLLLREKADTSYLLIVQKQNSHWIPNILMQDFGKNIQNVKDKIPDIKNADFKIFQFEHLYFYSYISKKEQIYEDMRGNILTPKMMCNKLFTIIDAIKEAAEKGEILYL